MTEIKHLWEEKGEEKEYREKVTDGEGRRGSVYDNI